MNESAVSKADIERVLAEKPRWHYRFSIYSRALCLLREAAEILNERAGKPLFTQAELRAYAAKLYAAPASMEPESASAR